ncbi:hypothetical protein BMF94_3099 [Rhodotorula taiwanensis]|uniref:F-box domain-containing protein n=1 Tax=Rhodotorula taiwanensis TaxID=741276 RepID=A0A2S5BAN6_9BASI|nr:hypothetical protein BMF94_3099 [Rhodotorula taiwanensis]
MPKRPRSAADSPAGQLGAARSASLSTTSASGAGPSTRQQDSQSWKQRSGGLRYKSTSFAEMQRKRPRPTEILRLHSLEGSLSEEVLLRCLSFLPAHDLVTVSRVSSAWYRLAQDPQLWRSLYLRTYASSTVRRQAALGVNVQRSRPWRELYQISTNWRNGSARATTLGTNLRRAVLPEVPPLDAVASSSLSASLPERSTPPRPLPIAANRQETEDTLLQFHQQFILSASRSTESMPSVTVHQTLSSGASAVVGSFGSERLRRFYAERPGFQPSLSLTEMRLEEAVPPGATTLLCALFYSTGQYTLFCLTMPDSSDPSRPFEAREVYTSLATGLAPHYHDSTLPYRTTLPFDPVMTARLQWPLLVTLTESLTMRFLRLSWQDDRLHVDETETALQSRERWAPVVLNLARWPPCLPDKEGAPESFRVSLAYSTPVFPASWTVGLQQFDVSVPSSPLSPLRVRAEHATAAPAYTPLPSTTRRTAPLADTGGSSSPSRPSSPSSLSPSPVTSIEHSHPFVVTSRIDNTIDVYEVASSYNAVSLAGGSVPSVPPLRIRSPASPASVPVARKRKARADQDLDVRQEAADGAFDSARSTEGDGDAGTEWQRLKRRRGAAASSFGAAPPAMPAASADLSHPTGSSRPRHVKRVWVGDDKIVLLQAGPVVAAGTRPEEQVQVLRFD